MIKVIYNKTCGRCVQSEPLTSGMVGQPIEFEYSPDFDGLTLTAVFTNGKTTVDVLNPDKQCVIPHDVLDTVGTVVKVGIYATKGNKLVIPTVYATIGIVLKGADPSGDVSADPTLPVWAQIQGIIGNLNDLTTEAKNSLVAAINEAAQTGSGSASIAMRVDGGYIQYSTDDGQTWVNLIAEADLKGDKGANGVNGKDGAPGKDGISATHSWNGPVLTITSASGTSSANLKGDTGDTGPQGIQGVQGPQGERGSAGAPGKDGKTPTIGANGNWYLGETDTGKPSRGETGPAGADGRDGADGQPGAEGKSAYQYAQEGGYIGTETEFAAKLAEEMPDKLPNPNALTFTGAVTGSYDGSAPLSVEIPGGGSGGGGISAFEKIGTIDLSTMAASNLGVDFTVNDVTEIVLIWTGMTNTTTSNSSILLAFNSSVYYLTLGPRTGKAGTPQNGYTYLKVLENVGILPIVSAGATSNTNYTQGGSPCSYNLIPVKEKIKTFEIRQPSTQYYADAGIVEVYVR